MSSSALLVLALTAVPAVAPPPPAAPAEKLSTRAIYDRGVRGTVFVHVPGRGTGTGWVIDARRRLVVTNYHVAADGPCDVYFPIFSNGKIVSERRRYVGRAVPARVLDSDPQADLSVLEVSALPEGTRALPLAVEEPSPGDRLHLVGNPGAGAGLFAFTTGTARQFVRAQFRFPTGQSVDAAAVEAQMATNKGDSGSAVLDDGGAVVGVNFSLPADAHDRGFAWIISLGELRSFFDDVVALRSGQGRADAFERRAARLSRKGMAALAIADLDRAVDLDAARASAYALRAKLQLERGHHDAALMDATRALALDPKDADSANTRANAHSGRGDEVRALADYGLALTLRPDDVTFLNNRGMAYAALNRPEPALADFDRAIRLSPGSTEAYRARGVLHHRRKEHARAIADFQAGVGLAPNDPLLLNWLAVAQLEAGQHAPAAETYLRALKLAGDRPSLWRGLGDARLGLAQFDLAVEAYSQAVKIDGRDAAAWFRRGKSLEERGDLEEAQADYAKAVELSPSLAAELKTFEAREVKVSNVSGEALKVHMRSEAAGGAWVTWSVAAGATVTLYYEGKPVHARKVRIWAEGTRSGKKFDTLKKRNLVLAERAYRARKIDAHVHAFGQ